MRSAVVVVLLARGVAYAELPPPIVVDSAKTATTDLTKLIGTTSMQWCQPDALGPGEPLTITMAEPALIGGLEIEQYNGGNTLGGAEITVDGLTLKIAMPRQAPPPSFRDPIVLPLPRPLKPVKVLVVKVITTEKAKTAACVTAIKLHGASKPDPVVLSGVAPASAAALWSSVASIKDALTTCNAKALGATVAFPLQNHWSTTSNDGMTDNSTTWKSPATLAGACKKRKLVDSVGQMALAEPSVQVDSATQVTVSEGGTMWTLQLDGDHWRLHSIHMGG